MPLFIEREDREKENKMAKGKMDISFHFYAERKLLLLISHGWGTR